MKVSICIPTRNRPDYLLACISSCLRQTLPPREILVGDDSDGEESRIALESFLGANRPEIQIRYLRNEPPLGQGRNVERLFKEARGELLCLIHDDDLLLDTAIENLLPCFGFSGVIIAYGLQKVADDQGNIDETKSEFLNRSYFRTPAQEGVQESLLESALTSQLPNNGFLVNASCARKAGYHDPRGTFGTGADFGFGVRLAGIHPEGKACFVNLPTAVYRESEDSIQRSGRSTAALHAFAHLLTFPAGTLGRERIALTMRRKAPVAIFQAASSGRWREGFSWYWGPWHRRLIATPGGIRRLYYLLRAMIREFSGPSEAPVP